MKKALVALALVGAFAVVFALGWISHAEFGKACVHKPNSGGAPVASMSPGNPAANTHAQVQHPLMISPGELQQLRVAREAVLRTNPDLAAEYKQIMDEMQAQQTKVDAAIIKADPKAAPIVAKLVVLRQRNEAAAAAATPSPK